jgi:hypothetical protein
MRIQDKSRFLHLARAGNRGFTLPVMGYNARSSVS